MKISELRKKNKKELEKDLEGLREKLGDFRFKLAANKLKNVREIRNTKKDIARIMTILNQNSKIKKQNDKSKIKNTKIFNI